MLLKGFDTSWSDRHALGRSAEALGELGIQLDSERTWLTLARFDDTVQEIYSGPLPDSNEELLSELAIDLKPVSMHPNTYFEKFIGFLADRIPKCRGRCVVILSTDGFGEAMSEDQHQAAFEAAKKLAACQNLAAMFLEGVAPENRAQLRKDLEPLGSRVQFVSSAGPDGSVIASLLYSGGVSR